MHRRLSLTFAILFGFAAFARASATLVVGNYELAPNQNGGPENTFTIQISGNDTNIAGVEINAQIPSGGPGFTGDLLTPGALFATNNTGIRDLNPGQVYGDNLVFLQTSTLSDVVSDVGGVVLLTLTFDTTKIGYAGGTWPLLFSGTVNGDTGIGATTGLIPMQITNGTISVPAVPDPNPIVIPPDPGPPRPPVPEPSSFVLAAFGLTSLTAWGWRRRSLVR